MNLKFVLKAFSLLLLTSFVFADDCSDIKDYLVKKFNKENAFEEIIEKCNTNDQGKVIAL